MTDVLAIIPARAGSKGIPRKNLALCGGRRLVDWTVEAANASRLVTHAVLSSDDTEILSRSVGKVSPLRRSPQWAEDGTPTEDVIAVTLLSQSFEPEIVVLLQPTSPLRTGEHIDQAIEQLQRTGADSVVSVVPSHAFLWERAPHKLRCFQDCALTHGHPLYTKRRRRQEMEQYEENGAIYVFTMEHWRRTQNRLGGRVELYVMDEEHRLQVDTSADLEDMTRLLERVMA